MPWSRQQDHGPSFKGWDYRPLLCAPETTARYRLWFWAPLNTGGGQTGGSSARAPSQLGLEQLRYEERLKDGLGQGWLRGGWQRTET